MIPVDDLVLNAITAHMQRWAPGPGQILITNRLGGPVQRNSFGYCWREAVSAAGLPAGTRFHDLRHTYASALIRAGLHPKVIQERLGHATIAVACWSASQDEIEPLTLDEALRVIRRAASRRNGTRWSVALALGLRQGEALGLRWQYVDLEAGTLTVRWQLQRLAWHLSG